MEFQGGLLILLLIGGYLFGRLAEKRHLKQLIRRERESSLPAIASRYPPEDAIYHQHLVSGSVVIASDYFKSFVASLINIFGGRVTPFESMIDRARREALLRMKSDAEQRQAAYVFNVKFDTTRVAVGRVGAMEVLAYGTAMIPADASGDVQSGTQADARANAQVDEQAYAQTDVQADVMGNGSAMTSQTPASQL